MQQLDVVVDFGGMVLFDCAGLAAFYGAIDEGANLYARLTTSDEGEKVVDQGIVLPIIGINDSSYRVIVRLAGEASPVPSELVILRNAVFPLRVTGRVVLADLAVLHEWYPDDGWHDVDIAEGCYAVAVNGFRRIEAHCVTDFGFEIVFTPQSDLPACTASLAQDMQVLEPPA